MKNTAWAALDIYETEGAYVVEVEVPGVPQEQIHVHMDNHHLVIESEASETRPALHRTLRIGQGVQGEAMEAEYQYGLLRLRLPKAETVKRQIEVHAL